MLLYPADELRVIRDNLKAGKRRFTVIRDGKERDCIFSGTDLLIDRNNHSVSSGLMYDPVADEFLFNYPHIANANEQDVLAINQITDLNGIFVERKYNGTNLAFQMRRDDSVSYRTRGMLNPISFYNEINQAIIQDTPLITGILPEVYKEFLQKYRPIFDEGRSSGAITDSGEVALQKFASLVKSEIDYLWWDVDGIVTIFGEFVTRYNPITVDEKMSAGIHLDYDQQFIIFDILVKEIDGYKFLSYSDLQKYVKTTPHTRLVEGYDSRTTPAEFLVEYLNQSTEEGAILKFRYKYLKLKLPQVLKWERMMGQLGTVINYAVNHVFEQGAVPYTDEEIFEKKLLTQETAVQTIYETIWREINSMGVSKENLISHFIVKSKSELDAQKHIDLILWQQTYQRLCPFLANKLQERGVKLRDAYLEIPKYLWFREEPLEWNERRQKFLGKRWYLDLLRYLFAGQSWT